ncbi:hypothetical protein [Legionella sp. CNM-4043-24]|uniref:hypothetical protein n=1 Tax=Legionella sp. CNM-4043-24 TaxID=3421646 RepID=UPI00403B3181
MYEYFAITESINDDISFGSGTVSTKNPIASIFFSTTFNIRKKDLISAFNKTEKFLVFSSESAMLDYFDQNPAFSGTSTLHFETAPLFIVGSEIELSFDNNDFIELEPSNLQLIAGKLRQLDSEYQLSNNLPYFDLTSKTNNIESNEIIHPSKFTSCTIL